MKVSLANPLSITYSNLLHDARAHSFWAKRRTFGGWTKEQRCVLVLKQIFEKFKEITPGNSPADIQKAEDARKALTKVLLNDVLPKVGPVAASLVVGRKDEMKVFFELLTKSQHLEKVEPSLGVQNQNLQWINVNGEDGETRPGYASIWNMTNEQVKACRASLAKFAEKLEAVTDETCVLLGYNKDDFFANLRIAKTQLDRREARLKHIASRLPGKLRAFATAAKKMHRWLGGDSDLGTAQEALRTHTDHGSNLLKTELEMVGSLYKGKTDADIMKISAQMDDFIELGYVSRRKGAEDDDFRQPILRGMDVIASLACGVLGPGLISFASKNQQIKDVTDQIFPSSGWSALASGVIGLIGSSYLNGGFVASLFM